MKTINTSGKRKSAIARATIMQGKGKIRVNNILIDNYFYGLYKEKALESVSLVKDLIPKVDIDVIVRGGGINAQAEAVRLAITKALVDFFDKTDIKEKFLEYDRHLLIADTRFKETRKPNRSKARAKRQTSYR